MVSSKKHLLIYLLIYLQVMWVWRLVLCCVVFFLSTWMLRQVRMNTCGRLCSICLLVCLSLSLFFVVVSSFSFFLVLFFLLWCLCFFFFFFFFIVHSVICFHPYLLKKLFAFMFFFFSFSLYFPFQNFLAKFPFYVYTFFLSFFLSWLYIHNIFNFVRNYLL